MPTRPAVSSPALQASPARARLGLIVIATACGAALPLACHGTSPATTMTTSSSSSGAPGFVASDAQPEASVNPANCVPPGTASNANGVGGYCTPGGEECSGIGADATLPLCTADLNGPDNAWFCTILCETDATCGPGGATCIMTIQGQACVPSACVKLLVDAGDDASPDADDAGEADDAASDG